MKKLLFFIALLFGAGAIAAQPTVTGNTKVSVTEGNNTWRPTLNTLLSGRVGPDSSLAKTSGSYLNKRITDALYKYGTLGLRTTDTTGVLNIAAAGNKFGVTALDVVNLLKYKRGTMPGWYIQQKAGSNGDGTTNNVLSIDYNQHSGVSTDNAADAQFGLSMEPHWVTGEGDTVAEFHVYFNDLNGANNRPITGFFDYFNHRESYVSVQIDNANFPGHLGNLHCKMNINRQNGSTALYPLEVYKHKKTLTTTNTSFSRAELDSATVFVLGNYNTGGESTQLGLSTLMRFTNTQDRRATFYMGLLDIEGSFDGGTDFIGFHQNSGVFRESFRIADNTGYFGIGLRGGNRPLQLLDVNGTSLHRGSARFNAPGDSSAVFIKSAGGATAKMIDLANTAGDVNVFVTSATPESSVTGSPGDLALSTGGAAYLKETGSATNTGWQQLATGVASNSLKTYYLTRTLPASGNTIELGIFNHTGGGAGYAEIHTVVNNGAGNSISKKYLVPFYFGNTGGNWQNLLPIVNTGAYSGNDYKLEMRSSSTRDTLRVRTTAGSTGGTLLVSIVVTPYQGSSSTFTETTTTATSPTAVTATYQAEALSQEGAKVGVNTLSPVRTLDITGEVRISDLSTDTPTRIVGADADGDLDDIALSAELTISSGTLKLAQQSATSGQVLEWNGSAWAPATDDGGGGGVTDGDKGDITVSSSGTNWQIDADAVGAAEIAADAVGTSEIATDGVGSAEIAAGAVAGAEMAQDGATTGQVWKWGGSAWAPGSIYNQLLRDDGTDKTQRNAVNFTSSATVVAAVTDDGANGESEVSMSIPTDGITATELSAGSVGTSEVADNSLAAGDLAVNVVSSIDGVTNDGGDVDFVAGENVTITPSDGSDNVTFEALGGSISPSQITSDQDDYNPTNWSTNTTARISGDGTIRAITSFAALADGTIRRLVNTGTAALYIPAEHPDGTAANRVAGACDQVVAPNGGVLEMYYDGTSSRWRVLRNTFNPADMLTSGVVGHYYYMSAGSTVAADWGSLGLATASGGNGQTAPTSALPGGFDINTASSASGVATLYWADGLTNPVEIGSAHIVTSCAVYFPTLSDGTQTYTFQFGIIPSPTSTTLNVNNSITIRYTNGTNSGKFQGVSRDNAGTESTADLGVTVAANTNYVLTVAYDKARSEARFYVNGAYAGRVTGNMPNATDAGGRVGIFKSAGTTSRSASVASYTFYTIY